MTIEALIANVKSVNAKSAHADTVFLMWVNELEADIQLKLWLLSIEDVIAHEDISEELLADAAHTIVYRLYLIAMIDLANGEYTNYQNNYKVFSDAYGDYKCWYIMKYHPGTGEAEELGYYLSAYALAVKHGYEGTEEEWIAAVEAARLSAEESAAAALASAEAAALSESNVAEDAAATLEAAQAALSAKGSAEAASANAVVAKDAALAAQAAAELAEAHAETAEANAETAEGGAVTAKNEAITAKDAAVVAKTAAEAAKGAAETAQLAAETAQGLAETAKTAAESAQTGAISAKDAAVTAKNAAVAAQGLAETANTAAQGAKTAAETAQGLAEDARDAAQDYASDAHTDALAAASAKTDAQTAKTAAELAETNAKTAQTAAELAETHAETAETNAGNSASAANTSAGNAATSETNADNARIAAQTAQTNAELAETHAETAEANAETAETNAEGHAEDAEAWADGTINGIAVTSAHPAYHNNSKYYKDLAAEIVGGDYPTKSEAQGYATTAKSEAISEAEGASVLRSLATAASQFLVSSGAGAWVIKTVAEIKTILGLGSAAYTDSTAYATSGQGTKADGAIQSSLGTAADQTLVSTGSGTWAVKTVAQIKTWLGLGAAAYLGTGTITGTVATGDHTHTSSGVTDFADTVRSTVLTGFSTATNAVIAATDTVLGALGKLQAQITANLSSFNSHKSRHASGGADALSPSDIGAASSSHSHAASDVNAGTLAGQVVANSTAVATLGTAQVRNIYAGTSDMTAGVTALATGDLYFVYE